MTHLEKDKKKENNGALIRYDHPREIKFLKINKKLNREKLKYINKGNIAYLMFYKIKTQKMKVFSIAERNNYYCDIIAKYPLSSIEINNILKNLECVSINADNSYFIFPKNNSYNNNVYKISYNQEKNEAYAEKIKSTIYNRKACGMLYCRFFNILILAGGGDKPDTSEYLDLSNVSEGWHLISKKIHKAAIYGKLFILNNSKLFLIYSKKLSNEYQGHCEIIDLEEELKFQNSEDKEEIIKDFYNNRFWNVIKIKANISMDWKIRIFQYYYLGKEKIILFKGKDFEKKNISNKYQYYSLEHNKEENDFILKEKEIDVYNYVPYVCFSNCITLDNLKMIDKENNINKDDYPLVCNYDYKGNLWFLSGENLMKMAI